MSVKKKTRGVGRPFKSYADETRITTTISLFKREWDQLDEIGPSRGKAVGKLLGEYNKNKLCAVEVG